MDAPVRVPDTEKATSGWIPDVELQATVSLSPLQELQLLLTSELHPQPLQSIRNILKN